MEIFLKHTISYPLAITVPRGLMPAEYVKASWGRYFSEFIKFTP